MTYRPIAETETDPEASLNSDLFKALVGNPLAQFEGDVNAPINAWNWHPYNKVTVGDANDGRFWSFAVNGGLLTITTPDFEAGYDYRIVLREVTTTAVGSPVPTLDHFWQTANVWAGPDTLTGVSFSSSFGTGFIDFMNPMATKRSHQTVIDIVRHLTTDATSPNSNYKNTRGPFRAVADRVLRARLSLSVGGNTYNGGAMHFERRRTVEV